MNPLNINNNKITKLGFFPLSTIQTHNTSLSLSLVLRFATSTQSLSLSHTHTQAHNDNNFSAEFRPCNCDRLCLLFSRILMNFHRRRRSHDIGDLYRHNMSLNRVFIATDVRRPVITARPLDIFFNKRTNSSIFLKTTKINFLTKLTFNVI